MASRPETGRRLWPGTHGPFIGPSRRQTCPQTVTQEPHPRPRATTVLLTFPGMIIGARPAAQCG
jgi:hypothetical protein